MTEKLEKVNLMVKSAPARKFPMTPISELQNSSGKKSSIALSYEAQISPQNSGKKIRCPVRQLAPVSQKFCEKKIVCVKKKMYSDLI